jgi:hypothetical protein
VARASHGDGATALPALGPFQPHISIEVLPTGTSYLPNQTGPTTTAASWWTGPSEEPAYVTGFRADPGNRLVAHHLVIHSVSPT